MGLFLFIIFMFILPSMHGYILFFVSVAVAMFES
jgi:hypothetical protein